MQFLRRTVSKMASAAIALERAPIASPAAAPHVPIPRNGVDYRNKIVLAPMVRSGELPMRLISLHYGADLVWGPETVDRALIGSTLRHNDRARTLEWVRFPNNGQSRKGETGDRESDTRASVIYRIHPELEKGKLIYQIGTSNPDLAVKAADMVGPYVAGVDLNSGCPKPFSTSDGMGAALLSTPDLLCNILERLVKEVGAKYEIGISVKIRLMPTEAETRTLVERLVKTGITGLTIHCRTRNMRKTERAVRDHLRMIGEICRNAGVACLMNGDVEDRDQAEQLARDFEVDGGMIATAAEKDPSCFRAKKDGGKADWKDMLHRYMRYAIDIENRWGNTKFTLAQIVPGKIQSKHNLNQFRNNEHICRQFEFEDLIADAVKLDELHNITEHKTKQELKAMRLQAQNKNRNPNKKRRENKREGEQRASQEPQAKKSKAVASDRPEGGKENLAQASVAIPA